MTRTLLISLGSRGDMEPFLALGESLLKQNHVVGFCFPAQFESLAKEVSPHWYPQSATFLDLLSQPEVKAIMGQVGSWYSRLFKLSALTKKFALIQAQLILDQESAVEAFKPDAVIFHIKCIYPIFWHFQTRGKIRVLSPMPCMIHPVFHEPHIGFGAPGNRFWNRLTYWLANQAIVRKSILGYGKDYIQKRGLNLTANRLTQFLVHELEVEYPIDSRLFPRPDYWPERAVISNFRERHKSQHYTPDTSLLQFLESHPNPLFITFGSMINAQPEQIGMDIVRVATKHQLPIIVNTSWGGIVLPKELPPNLFCVEDIPYDFLFPLVCAVIHHGGSGTTHSALRCDRPQAIIPHIGDQFFWNRMVAQSGKGVLGFPIKKWQYQRFETLVLELVSLTSK